jgi:hypothetical protein
MLKNTVLIMLMFLSACDPNIYGELPKFVEDELAKIEVFQKKPVEVGVEDQTTERIVEDQTTERIMENLMIFPSMRSIAIANPPTDEVSKMRGCSLADGGIAEYVGHDEERNRQWVLMRYVGKISNETCVAGTLFFVSVDEWQNRLTPYQNGEVVTVTAPIWVNFLHKAECVIWKDFQIKRLGFNETSYLIQYLGPTYKVKLCPTGLITMVPRGGADDPFEQAQAQKLVAAVKKMQEEEKAEAILIQQRVDQEAAFKIMSRLKENK